MKGSECRLIDYVEGNKKRFIIPVYQRSYDWEESNCKKMFDDLVNAVNRKTHFFGTMCSVINSDAIDTEIIIIDGHQRLTTLSLLFLAMYNLLEQGILTSKDSTLSERILELYLIDKWDNKQVKLKLTKFDVEAYNALFKNGRIAGSNITRNYDYFYNRIQKQEITIDELFASIKKLEIINVQAQEWDNPQLIFESLNSTGLALSEGDKVRNFVLMGLRLKYQEHFYNNYWLKIENYCNRDVTNFVRDYLSVKMVSTPAFSKIYFTFKEYASGKKTEALLDDMLAYARNYQILIKGYISIKKVSACIKRLNILETTVTRPFFLEVLRLWKEKKITDEDLTEIFLTTESYIFRRIMVDLPTNGLNKIFVTLHKDIMKFGEENYASKFNYVLLSKKERARFPSDDEFISAFRTRQVYNMKSKVYILERFENFDTLEDRDIYRHIENGTYSI